MRYLLTIAAFTSATATCAFAEDTLTPLPAPAERPYPYKILGLQPGDPLDDVLAVYSTPEPGTLLSVLGGLVGVAAARRRHPPRRRDARASHHGGEGGRDLAARGRGMFRSRS